ncbi:hypothetical protein [Arthrobacter sp. MA-N2]|uniref:hypothetical protein n=1 Tax=Arthrobacter sp. MA-N2 TaxID=1101188 RepID=UPI0004BA8680|nr:hypothetical protein [Arthrobacter sp. MA-N2]
MSPTMDQPRRAQVARERTKPSGRRRAEGSAPFIPAPVSEPSRSTAVPTTRAAARAAERKRAAQTSETAAITMIATEATAEAPTASRPNHAPASFTGSSFSQEPHTVLKKTATVRTMSHRMVMVTGALGILLAAASVSQALELPFFGHESPAQDVSTANTEASPLSGPPSAAASVSPTATASLSAATPTAKAGQTAEPAQPPRGTAAVAPSSVPAPSLSVQVPSVIPSTVPPILAPAPAVPAPAQPAPAPGQVPPVTVTPAPTPTPEPSDPSSPSPSPSDPSSPTPPDHSRPPGKRSASTGSPQPTQSGLDLGAILDAASQALQ